MKKAYESPTVSKLGRVEDVTQSQSWFNFWDNRGLFPNWGQSNGLS